MGQLLLLPLRPHLSARPRPAARPQGRRPRRSAVGGAGWERRGMTAHTPVDQKARDKVRTDHAHTLFVEAAAGTGKTQALVDRVVSLVARGTALRTIAAITFTEA